MHIRTLKNLITLLQRIHTHLMCFQSRSRSLDTIRDKRTRRTGWRGDSAVDEREDRVSTDFVGFDVEVLHFGEGEVFGCDSLCSFFSIGFGFAMMRNREEEGRGEYLERIHDCQLHIRRQLTRMRNPIILRLRQRRRTI